MKSILFVLSSARGWQSHSHQIAHRIVDDLKMRHPRVKVLVRDLAREPLPHIGEAFVNGQNLPPEKRSPAQARALITSDAMVDELGAADIVVLAVPMYNFGVPSSLKAWIDHILRAGRTFSYSEKGPQGLLQGKTAVVVVSRGGVYSEGPMQQFDFQESYLRHILAFIGITDVHVVRIEGVAMGDEKLRQALVSAQKQADEVVREIEGAESLKLSSAAA